MCNISRRHLFLEDSCKKARVIKKLHLPNCGKDNSLVPRLQMPKFGVASQNTKL